MKAKQRANPRGPARPGNPLARVIQAVQVRRRQVEGLEEDGAWRDFLERAAGCRSLRAMTAPQLGQVLDALVAGGAPRQVSAPQTRAQKLSRPSIALNAQAAKARALWRDLYELGEVESPEDRALDAFCAGARGPGVASLRWCDSAQLNHVIEALKEWCGRGGFVVPDTRDGGRAALLALARAQWARLHGLGAARERDIGLWVLRYAGSLDQVETPALHRLIGELGEWLRRELANGAAKP